MFRDNLVNAVDKPNVLLGYDSLLKSLRVSDSTRPWDTYSHEPFRRFWDERCSVDLDAEVRSR